MFFIQQAYAQTADGQVNGSFSIMSLLFPIALFVVVWVLMIRPQQKRAKEHRNLIESLKKGDEIITSSGIMGRIMALNEQAVDLEIAKNTTVRIQRYFVTQVLPKGSLKGDLGQYTATIENNTGINKEKLSDKSTHNDDSLVS